MKLLPASFAAVLVALGAGGPASAQQPELVQQVQRVLVASLDSGFPSLSLEQWLAQLPGRSAEAIRWEANDCGEGGDGLAAPTCVEAVLQLARDTTAHLSLIVAGIDGTRGVPAIWMLYGITGASIATFKRLRDWVAFVEDHKFPRTDG